VEFYSFAGSFLKPKKLRELAVGMLVAFDSFIKSRRLPDKESVRHGEKRRNIRTAYYQYGRTPESTPSVAAASLSSASSPPGVDPMSEVDWDQRSAVISGEDGRVVFEQRDVDVPALVETATNVVVSKYFRGPLGSPKRETSVRQLIGPRGRYYLRLG